MGEGRAFVSFSLLGPEGGAGVILVVLPQLRQSRSQVPHDRLVKRIIIVAPEKANPVQDDVSLSSIPTLDEPTIRRFCPDQDLIVHPGGPFWGANLGKKEPHPLS